MTSVNQLSENLLRQVRLQKPTEDLVHQLAALNFEELNSALSTDSLKKAFWINCYNCYFQLLRRKGIDKPKVFTSKRITIAGVLFSLDDLEHGILRKGKYKSTWRLFLAFFVPKPVKALAVENLDYRIHFALNCGAKSCPPIAFYSAERIEAQLEMATLSFLKSETIEDPKNNVIYISTLFKWYWTDFGGKVGVEALLESALNISTKGKELKFAPYSWEEDLNSYTTFDA